jgi:hypothetical protein
MRNASIIEDWIDEAAQEAAIKARAEGEMIGERKESQAILTRLLAKRFGRLPRRLNSRLEPLTVVQLEELIDYVVEAPDIATFEQRLSAV